LQYIAPLEAYYIRQITPTPYFYAFNSHIT
jgi:hypothetical protein